MQYKKYTKDDKNTHKKTTKIYTANQQQYTQENYNNTHEQSTAVHTRQLQKYTRQINNNTHKKPTTIHTANEQQLHGRKPKISNITRETNSYTGWEKGKNTQVIDFLHIVTCDWFCNIYVFCYIMNLKQWLFLRWFH
jgi:hypothetical protein